MQVDPKPSSGKDVILKILAEAIGVFLLTLIVAGSANQYNILPFVLMMWLLDCYYEDLTGGFLNPVLILPNNLYNFDDHTPIREQNFFIIGHFLGAFAALSLQYALFSDTIQTVEFDYNVGIIGDITLFVLAYFFYLTMNFYFKDEDTCLIGKENANSPEGKLLEQLFLAISLYVSLKLTNSSSHSFLNPAIDFGLIFCNLYIGGWKGFSQFWIYLGAPVAGTALAYLFHQKVFEPMIKKQRHESDNKAVHVQYENVQTTNSYMQRNPMNDFSH